MSEALNVQVKLALYAIIAETGVVPDSAAVAVTMGLSKEEVLGAFQHLHSQRLLVPESGDASRIRMAPPFSGVPRDFRLKPEENVTLPTAFGTPTESRPRFMRTRPSLHPTADPGTVTLEVKNGQPVLQPYLAHFAVPAAHWWDNIVFT